MYEYLIALEELSMDNCTYRYIIVYDNENNLIYAECIKWLIGELNGDLNADINIYQMFDIFISQLE